MKKGISSSEGEATNEEERRALEESIMVALVDNRLPCPQAHLIAKKLKVTPRKVGETADAMGIRITSCQLGCF